MNKKELKKILKEFLQFPELALTFDDISAMPTDISYSHSRTDEDITLQTQISRNITLNLGYVASYMDSVSESEMGITTSKIGGMAIIHRLMSLEKQIEEVKLVKRHENKVILDPYTLSRSTPISEIKEKLESRNIGMFLIVSENKKLIGVVSSRDIKFRKDYSLTAEDVMTPLERLVILNPVNMTEDQITEKARELFIEHRLENIPLVDGKNTVQGLVSAKDLIKMENKLAVRDKEGHLVVGASIGLPRKENGYLDLDELMRNTGMLLDAKTDLIVLAIANAYLNDALIAVSEIRKNFPEVDLAAGTVNEYEGTRRLFEAGADTVLVGIGPGSICETRRVAGVGIPQFTALRKAQRAARECGKFILSDGGVSKPHHFNKALFAGANGVILGSVLAGTDASPGEIIKVNDRLMKFHRGLASNNAKHKFNEVSGKKQEIDPLDYWSYVYNHVSAEGVESGFVDYKGTTLDAIRDITGGLRSMMTYLGVKDIEGLWKRCDEGKYVRVSNAGNIEGNPHDLLSFRS